MGRVVAMSSDGTIVAVGSPGSAILDPDDPPIGDVGRVRVYQVFGGEWSQVGTAINGGTASDRFGSSVALSADGRTLAVGATQTTTSTGYVKVFRLSSGSWQQIGLTMSGTSSPDQFGYSVALSADGNTVAIGAPGNGSLAAGYVRIFGYAGGTWSQRGADVVGGTSDREGYSVALSDDGATVATGAPYAAGPPVRSGRVSVRQFVAGSWSLVGSPVLGNSMDRFAGWSVALSGDAATLAVGAANLSTSAGQVRAYRLASGSWAQIGETLDDSADLSGSSVALSADGNTLAYGASRAWNSAGTARIVRLSAGSWDLADSVEGDAGDNPGWSGDNLGWSVAMSDDGNMVVAGAPFGGDPDAGYARVISRPLRVDVVGIGSDPAAGTVSFTATFSAPVSGFGADDVVGALGAPVTVTGGPAQYVVTASGFTTAATVPISIRAGAAVSPVTGVANAVSNVASVAFAPPPTDPPTIAPSPAAFVVVSPARVVDSRTGLGLPGGVTRSLAAGEEIEVPLAGRVGVTADASAVVLNVTATRVQAPGYLTLYGCGTTRPDTSNVNYRAGADTANLTISAMGTSGSVCLFTSAALDVIVDVVGYSPGGFTPSGPARIADTRSGARPGAGAVVRVPLPAGTAHVVTVTSTRSTQAGFLTVYDCDAEQPGTSNVNFSAGVDVPNLVVVAADGELCVYTSAPTDVLVDHLGTLGSTTGLLDRLVDTRGGAAATVGTVVKIPSIVSARKLAIVNLTATNTTGAGYLSLYACDQPVPDTSNLNVTPGSDIGNLAIVPTGTPMCVYVHAATDVIVDVLSTLD